MTIPKNATNDEIITILKGEGYSDKRVASFLRGWDAVKNNSAVKDSK